MDSRLEEPEFRLLASVYAALGPDAVGVMRNHDVGYAESCSSSKVVTKALPKSWAQKPLLVPHTVSSSVTSFPQLASLKLEPRNTAVRSRGCSTGPRK